MLGILFKIITAAFPFLREMLFGRSATGRTHMISFLIICNIALGVSFFVTAKLTATLYLNERKLKVDIIKLNNTIAEQTEKDSKNKHTDSMVIDVINNYNTLLAKSKDENNILLIELNECRNKTSSDAMRHH